ncbi:MAG: hypothetical protein ACREBT_01425 [Thermoplasmata archaeon]
MRTDIARRRSLAVVTVLGALVLASMLLAPSLAPPNSGSSAPAVVGAAGHGASSGTDVTAVPSANASNQCPTPQAAPDWTSPNFFQDALVQIQVPGYPDLSGSNFQIVPCSNTLPTYLTGFWLNVSTNVALTEAYLNVWGTTWPTAGNALPALSGFDPAKPQQMPMAIDPTVPSTASFFFNIYRFFYPGTTVYFNITLVSEGTGASPSTIYSTNSPYSELTPATAVGLASWIFYVQAPWWSPDFLSDIQITTTPPVTGLVAYPPNNFQQFNAVIESVGPGGGVGAAISGAQLNLHLTGNFTGVYSVPFGPQNHSRLNLTQALGPYPGTTVTFNISAWLDWEGGEIDLITSPTYSFNWSSQGGWPDPTAGLLGNAELSAIPSSVLGSIAPTLGTAASVNLTVYEPLPNVTIASSVIEFSYRDRGGASRGVIPMTAISTNTTYGIIPGLPDGGAVTFSVLAKDIFGNVVSSGNYSYSESGPPPFSLRPDQGFLFVEAENISSGTYLPGAAFTISNATWSASGRSSVLGFGYISGAGPGGYLGLSFGTYTVHMTAFGITQSSTITVSSSLPSVARFWFVNPSAAPLQVTANAPLPPIDIALIIGVVVVALAMYPLYLWFTERRRKAAEEQRRVTL